MQKEKKTEILKDKDQKESLILWCQGSFAIYDNDLFSGQVLLWWQDYDEE